MKKAITIISILFFGLSAQAINQSKFYKNVDLSANKTTSPSGGSFGSSGGATIVTVSLKLKQMIVRARVGNHYKRSAQFKKVKICRVADSFDIFIETKKGHVFIDLPEFPASQAQIEIENIIDESGNNYTKGDPINFSGKMGYKVKFSEAEFMKLKRCK